MLFPAAKLLLRACCGLHHAAPSPAAFPVIPIAVRSTGWTRIPRVPTSWLQAPQTS